jgi:hypothetical protein
MSRVKPALLVLSMLLAACTSKGEPGLIANTGSIYWTYYDTSYTPISDISIAGGSGQLLTQILGNPFDVDQAEFDKGVTDAMYAAHFGPPTHFTTEPTGSFKRIFYVRLAFGGTSAASINTICTEPPSPPSRNPSANGSVGLSAAFCQSGEPLSYLEAGGSGFSGPRDPRFVAFMQQVTFNLFPPQNSTLRRGQPGNCQWPSC